MHTWRCEEQDINQLGIIVWAGWLWRVRSRARRCKREENGLIDSMELGLGEGW
jgi:hypothetical protein